MNHNDDWPDVPPIFGGRDTPFQTCTLDEVRSFEQQHDLELHWQYRQFLMHFDGGRPEGGSIQAMTGTDEIYGIMALHPLIDRRGDEVDLYSQVNWDEFIPRDLLSIGGDGSGNWYCIAVRNKARGAIFFVDHEKPMDHFLRVVILAPDFDTFCANAIPPDPRMWAGTD